MNDGESVYDLAVSFAGEQRSYVEKVVDACKERHLHVLYDRDLTVDLWGRNFITEFRKAYGGQRARYVAPFFSEEYLAKPYPMDEFRAMLVPALDNPDEYILPVLVGNVSVPAEILSPAIGVLRSEDFTPRELANAFTQRITGVPGPLRRGKASAADIGTEQLRMPVTTPQSFSKYRELEAAFRYLDERFKGAASEMSAADFVCTVQSSDSALRVRVEQRGTMLYGLDIQLGGQGRDDVLNFALAQRGWNHGNHSHGSASPIFDREAGVPKLEMQDLSVLGTGPSTKLYTKEELFVALWNRIVDQVQQLTDNGREGPSAAAPPARF